MTASCRLLIASVISFTSCFCVAQSTSPWMKIAAPSVGLTAAPPPGEGYMSVSIKAASVYQDSHWWTAFVERNRQAVLTVNLAATIANIPVAQTVTGNAVSLNRNKSMVDLGFAGMVVDHLPTTFSGMNMSVQINKTAQDGLQNLISQVNQLSTATPPVLAISAQTMQITSLAKNVADFLFHANLLQMKVQTKNPFPNAGALEPGIYICFAGDSQTDYQQFLALPGKLTWNGAVLAFNGTPVNNSSYFIVEVNYETSYFADPLDALNFGASKPWVTLYLTAQNEIPGINTCAQAVTAQGDIQSHLADARTLLTQDYSFTNKERDGISDAVYTKLNAAYKARLTAIDPASCVPPPPQAPVQVAVPAPGGQPVPNPVADPAPLPKPLRPNLRVPDVVEQMNHEDIVQHLGPGIMMRPTGHF